jgi:hypothetical protein
MDDHLKVFLIGFLALQFGLENNAVLFQRKDGSSGGCLEVWQGKGEGLHTATYLKSHHGQTVSSGRPLESPSSSNLLIRTLRPWSVMFKMT